jgi:hypothetical protein
VRGNGFIRKIQVYFGGTKYGSYYQSTVGALVIHCRECRWKDAFFWDNHAVIYAEITEVKKDRGSYFVDLLPFATLTGKWDAAFDRQVTAGVWVTPETAPNASMINEVPKKGTKVVASIARPMVLKGASWFGLPNGPVMFMAQNKGTIEVTGFDDPKVTETIEKLPKLRAKQREEAEKNAPAKSAAAPKR